MTEYDVLQNGLRNAHPQRNLVCCIPNVSICVGWEGKREAHGRGEREKEEGERREGEGRGGGERRGEGVGERGRGAINYHETMTEKHKEDVH